MMTSAHSELEMLLSVCHVHLNEVDRHVMNGDVSKAEFRARELAENAKLLSHALFREQRRSGEVNHEHH